jgi:ParB family chromosome partitioning protein
VAKKRGLPQSVKMRHDDHFVDEISSASNPVSVRMIKIERILLNPHQPRKTMGNIDELAASVKEKGVIVPIIVRKKDTKFEVVAGERRVRAAKKAGLNEVPAIEMDIEDDEALELAIVENVQRKELTPFEEAFAYKTLNQIFGFTHEEIATRIGKSRSTISEIIKIAYLPERIINICQSKGIFSKSFLLELSKLNSENDMLDILEAYTKESITRDDLREKRKGGGDKPKRFVFNFASPDRKFKIKIQLKEENPSKDDLIEILTNLINSLKSGEIDSIS